MDPRGARRTRRGRVRPPLTIRKECDTNNNHAFLSGTIAATQNAASIYIAAKREPDKYKTEKGAQLYADIRHASLPAGPGGAFSYHGPFHHGVMGYSKNRKLAKDFLTEA